MSDLRDKLRALKSLPGPFPAFDPAAAPADPRDLFSSWLEAAIDAGIREPHAMTLSTVDEDGHPDARILILKNLDEAGWHFATTRTSPKGRQIEASPRAALTFYWQPLGRQVRISGAVVDLGTAAGNA
ncbi:MAG: pdxH, partial [Reyranella sp.]|nr:pdxH [Reyranella sp.]